MVIRFCNRTEAGQILAQYLTAYANKDNLLVLALPRGGVPVAFEVATALNAPLDVCIVRKLGVPGHKELAMGAIASGGVGVLNYDVIHTLGIDKETIQVVAAEELPELQRRDRTYRGDAPPLNVKNKTVILIDDGIATGSTMRAAIALLKQQQPKSIVVAVPVAPASTYKELQLEVDEIVCLQTPEEMSAIGMWYQDFSQTTDEEVRELLTQVKF
ncbi:phosphoribosyltransferase [Sphaerospermopsis aphanizomenoides BCCUSP55]|uniref:phosphoribosyltransferase n=1 Tax=Sphaerospermopsis aphanizomenoides TaxID=459663 RepID=UPI001904A070|nr:phosphoribosyltransferase [Sphaerospermopsis aphanizomenoides]MBK1989576.1 phosphoribosyltransferase [Sphaerospermopsis aphanizomenoides BCCUSP55]